MSGRQPENAPEFDDEIWYDRFQRRPFTSDIKSRQLYAELIQFLYAVYISCLVYLNISADCGLELGLCSLGGREAQNNLTVRRVDVTKSVSDPV